MASLKKNESFVKLSQLKGHSALVTGATSGLGLDFARQLAAAGINLILCARREEKLNEIKTQLEGEHKISVDIISLDLSKAKSAKTLYDFAKEKNISILINNAGMGLLGGFLDQDLNKSVDMMNLNMTTLVKLSHFFAKDMKEKANGYILQVASIAGFMPLEKYAVYAATKSFVLSFSQSLNWELSATGVSSTALCPGATRTDFFESAGHNVNKLISSTMMNSKDVVKVGLESMLKREDKVIAGMMNKITVGASYALPNQVSKKISAEFTR